MSPISAKSWLPFYIPLFVFSLAPFAGFIVAVFFHDFSGAKWEVVVGLIVCGALSIHSLWMVFDRRPFLLVDETGILDRRSGVHKTPWAEFSKAKLVVGFRGVFILQLELYNSDLWIKQRLSRTRRFLAKLTGLSTCYIPISLYDKDPIDIYKYVITKVPGNWL